MAVNRRVTNKENDAKISSEVSLYEEENGIIQVDHIYLPLCSGRIWHKVNF